MAGREYAKQPRVYVKNQDDFDWVATVQVSNVPEWHDNARLIALTPDIVRWAADAAEWLDRYYSAAEDAGFEPDEVDVLLAALANLVRA